MVEGHQNLSMKKTYDNPEDTLAYNLGFRDGLEFGYEKHNKYKRDQERHLYKMGYDAGVHAYCQDAHSEDETFDLPNSHVNLLSSNLSNPV